MNNFYYYNPTELVFGKEAVLELSSKMPKGHENILLHYGGGSIKKSGLYDEIIEELEKTDVNIFELSGVEANPKLSLVKEGIQICKDEDITFILAVGGGSVIDSAKAIAAGVLYDGDIWDCFLGKDEIEKALEVGVVLTLPATGSETSFSTVVTNEDTKEKKGIDHDILRPVFAIMDPVLTMTLPDSQTFPGIMDIMSHVFERYITNTKEVDLTTNLCEATLTSVMDNAYKLLEDRNNYDARANIMLAGTIAHGGILGLGREEDWASHRIGHEITALYGTTHGVTLSIIMPNWMKYVYKDNIEVFKRMAIEVFKVEENKTDEEIALEGIEKLQEFIKDIGLPTSLSEIDIDDKDFELMAEKCTNGSTVGRFKKLDKEDVINIYNLAK